MAAKQFLENVDQNSIGKWEVTRGSAGWGEGDELDEDEREVLGYGQHGSSRHEEDSKHPYFCRSFNESRLSFYSNFIGGLKPRF